MFRIETKDDLVSCPKQNLRKIRTSNCTGWNVSQPTQKCEDFVRSEDTYIICRHSPNKKPDPPDPPDPPGDEIITLRRIHKKSDGLKVDCPRYPNTGYASFEYCVQTCPHNRGYTFASVKCAYITSKEV